MKFKFFLWLVLFFLFPKTGLTAQLVNLLDSHEISQQAHVEVVQKRSGFSVHFSMANAWLDDQVNPLNDEKFQTFKSLELKNTEKAGIPALPYFSVLLTGTVEDIEIQINPGQKVFLDDMWIAPADNTPCRCEKDWSKVDRFALNHEAYSSADEKHKFTKLEYWGDFRGQPIHKLIIYPTQFLPQYKQLAIWPQLTVNVKSSQSTMATNISKNILANQLETERYLIVSADDLASSMANFIADKEKAGMQVELVTVDGRSAQELREMITEKYQTSRINYLLLVGHQDLVPTFFKETSMSMQTPTDLPYVTMGGEDDHIPDIFYGRIIANTKFDVQNQLEKIHEYTQQRANSPRGIGIASNEGSSPSDVEYLQQMQTPFSRLPMAFHNFLQDNSDSIPSNINAQLEKGTSWLNYIGHGSGFEWPSVYGRGYSVDDITDYQPHAKKPVIIDVACQNGRMDYEGTLGETFMNATVDSKPTGAVAYYGGSVDISWHPPAIMAVGISKEYFAQNIDELGKLVIAGQLHLLNEYSDSQAVEENFIWYHLFGDPSMKLNFQRP